GPAALGHVVEPGAEGKVLRRLPAAVQRDDERPRRRRARCEERVAAALVSAAGERPGGARRGCRERSQQDHDDNAFFDHFTARLAGGTGSARTAIAARIFGHFTARLAGGTGWCRTAFSARIVGYCSSRLAGGSGSGRR